MRPDSPKGAIQSRQSRDMVPPPPRKFCYCRLPKMQFHIYIWGESVTENQVFLIAFDEVERKSNFVA